MNMTGLEDPASDLAVWLWGIVDEHLERVDSCKAKEGSSCCVTQDAWPIVPDPPFGPAVLPIRYPPTYSLETTRIGGQRGQRLSRPTVTDPISVFVDYSQDDLNGYSRQEGLTNTLKPGSVLNSLPNVLVA